MRIRCFASSCDHERKGFEGPRQWRTGPRGDECALVGRATTTTTTTTTSRSDRALWRSKKGIDFRAAKAKVARTMHTSIEHAYVLAHTYLLAHTYSRTRTHRRARVVRGPRRRRRRRRRILAVAVVRPRASHCAMGRPMYLSSLIAAVCAAALVACPLDAVAGWPVDSSFYDEIKRVVYGDDNNNNGAIAASASVDSSPPSPPLSLPSSSQAQNINRPIEVEGWPKSPIPRLGQVSGVAINTVGQPVIFHRGSRVWDESSFNETFHYQHVEEGPILTNTIVTLSPKTGDVLSSWGAGFFYMPHGITIDRQGNVWVTDVAMHQVFKFSPGAYRPSLTFGKRFENGKGYRTLCQPTSVAVATGGEIFIADGYCNSRVLKYSSRGELLRVFPHANEFLSLQVPHSLALLEQHDLVCIADREDMRVVCRGAELSGESREQAPLTIQQPDLGRVYAITNHGDLIYAVNGPTSPLIPVRGFTINPMTENIVDHWTISKDAAIQVPHDIAISKDGSSLYVASINPNRVVKYTMTSVPLKSE